MANPSNENTDLYESAGEEVDLSALGPATRLAIRVAVQACDREIRLYDEKSSFRKLSAEEQRDLLGWQATRHQILTQPYPEPYGTGASHAPLAEPVT